MKLFKTTKLVLLLTLLFANVAAPKLLAGSCIDPNCCKACGWGYLDASYTRSCTEGPCYVSYCSTQGPPPCTDIFNDSCDGGLYCFEL